MAATAAHTHAPRIAIVVSRYNATITDRLLEGACRAYVERVGNDDSVTIVDAPGAFELPALADAAGETGAFDGVVALGCLIRGETEHDRHIARAVAHGLVDVSLKHGVPVTFGVLTVQTSEQAASRAGGANGNKGADAMIAVLDTIESTRMLRRAVTSGEPSARTIHTAPDKAGGAS